MNAVALTGVKRLIAGRWWAVKKMPYFSEIFLAMTPVPVEGYGTFGITAGLILLYDPAVLETWPVEKIGFVIAHEAMHRINRHSERAARARIPHDEFHLRLWNLAGDAMINETLKKACEDYAPSDAYLPQTLGLPSNITVEEAYALLLVRYLAAGEGTSPPHEPCGSGAGHAHDKEPTDIAQHPATRSEADVRHVLRRVAQEIQAKGRGHLPGELSDLADAILGTPRVPWEVLLRRALRLACTYVAGASDHTWGRGLSKLQAGVGFASGVALLPKLVDPEVRAWFVLDTSGSMSDAQMLDAAREVAGILRAAGGRLTYLANDARVHVMREVTDVQQLRGLFKGRGGTSFHPIFERFAETPSKTRPNVIVIATDGDGPAPEVPPAGVQVIWLLVEGRTHRPTRWGTYISLSKHGATTMPAQTTVAWDD